MVTLAQSNSCPIDIRTDPRGWVRGSRHRARGPGTGFTAPGKRAGYGEWRVQECRIVPVSLVQEQGEN